jgi:hypothetical protein
LDINQFLAIIQFVKCAKCFVMVIIYFSKIRRMNNNAYIVSGIIAFVFLVAKFLEMRFSGANANANSNPSEGEEAAPQPQSKPLKFLLRDAALVYVSSLLGFYIIAQFEERAATSANGSSSTVKDVAAFTGGPDF